MMFENANQRAEEMEGGSWGHTGKLQDGKGDRLARREACAAV